MDRRTLSAGKKFQEIEPKHGLFFPIFWKVIQNFVLRTSKAILRSLQENYANNDRYMNNNVDILSSVAGSQVRAGGHDNDLEGYIGF